MTAVTLEEFRAELAALKPGGAIGLPYDGYELLFPPGEPDEGARKRAYKFAKDNSCTISNHQAERIVFFIKSK